MKTKLYVDQEILKKYGVEELKETFEDETIATIERDYTDSFIVERDDMDNVYLSLVEEAEVFTEICEIG